MSAVQLMQAQLEALNLIQNQLTDLKSSATRHENQLARLAYDLQEMKRKTNHG